MQALVLVRPVAQRELIVAVNDAARERGIRPGMTLSAARALDSAVYHAEHDAYKDAVALEALARWMMRFSPIVAIADEAAGTMPGKTSFTVTNSGYYGKPTAFNVVNMESDRKSCRRTNNTPRKKASSGPSGVGSSTGLFLDLTGCELVFKGLPRLIGLIRNALDRLQITAHLTVASNPAAAWALSFSPNHQDAIVEDYDAMLAALQHLPPATLRLDPAIVASLHHLGLHTIGQVMQLPREELPARFGPTLLHRIDEITGRHIEPLVPLEPFSPIVSRMDFDGPIDDLETIWLVFKQLLEKIVAELARRGCGARAIDVEFNRAYAVTLHTTIRLSRPSRDPKNIFNLLSCAMEKIQTNVGFLGIQLIVSSSQHITDEQIALLGRDEFVAERELDHLVERLRTRMGLQSVERPVPVESHLPERAWKPLSIDEEQQGIRSTAAVAASPRPLTLLNQPESIGVIVSPFSVEGRPVSFTNTAGYVHRLIHITGPERIACQWWSGHNKTRDYFDVEDENGTRFWIFRVQETNRWFVQAD